jgi:hypothetical protein
MLEKNLQYLQMKRGYRSEVHQFYKLQGGWKITVDFYDFEEKARRIYLESNMASTQYLVFNAKTILIFKSQNGV